MILLLYIIVFYLANLIGPIGLLILTPNLFLPNYLLAVCREWNFLAQTGRERRQTANDMLLMLTTCSLFFDAGDGRLWRIGELPVAAGNNAANRGVPLPPLPVLLASTWACNKLWSQQLQSWRIGWLDEIGVCQPLPPLTACCWIRL